MRQIIGILLRNCKKQEQLQNIMGFKIAQTLLQKPSFQPFSVLLMAMPDIRLSHLT